MKEPNANILLNRNSLQLKSSGVSLTSSFPLRFSGSPQVAAFSVFGVFFSKVVNHKISHVQFRGFESSRLWKTHSMFIGTANFISSFILENVEKQEINLTDILGSWDGIGVASNRGVTSGLSLLLVLVLALLVFSAFSTLHILNRNIFTFDLNTCKTE